MEHRPTSQQIQVVIDTFKSILPMVKEDRQLDMRETHVNVNYDCGTSHCHWGWYAIARDLHRNRIVSFTEGGHVMAKDLGFQFHYELMEWASKNPKIWGNEHGQFMGSGVFAFGNPIKRPKGARNLQDIVDHWEEVLERVREIEQNEQRVNITKQLAVLPVEEKLDLLHKLEKA